MRITLISPRIAVQKGDFLGSGVPYWPVEMAVLAAFLRERGNEVEVVDLFGSAPKNFESKGDHYLQGLSFSRAAATPAVTQADFFILYAMSYMSHGELLSITEMLSKSRPGIPVGILENSQAVTAYDLASKAREFFDAGARALICGEPYWNWDEIQACLVTRGSVPDNVLVPVSAADRTVRRRIEMHPSYPVPAWDLFPLANYWALPYSHGPKTKRFLPMLTSRGCPYPCDFCVVPETNSTRWRPRAAEEVVREMISLRERFGIRDFQIEDLNPTVNPSRWESICGLLIERQAGIRFYFVSGTKAETVRLSQIPLFAKAGCRYISISPESGSPAVLKAIGKPFDHAHGLALVKACRENGISTQACILVGHPSETPDDHKLSSEYITSMVRAGLDEVAVFVIAPLAGSALSKQGRIGMADDRALASFSPTGRTGWKELSRRRRSLIRTFFIEKLKRGGDLWAQGLRAVMGRPKTKMENLPRRLAFIYWNLGRFKLRRLGAAQAATA